MTTVTGTVEEAFGAYELALAAHDVDALDGFFLDHPATRRFGVDDEQCGAAEISRWRRSSPAVPAGRYLAGTQVQDLGGDVAVVTTRFGYGHGAASGRQTQVWVRTSAGWRIASAHVSHPAPAATAS